MLFEDLHTNMVVRIINYEEDGNDRPDHWESDMDEWQGAVVTIAYLEKDERVFIDEDEGEWQWYPWDFEFYDNLDFNDPNLTFKRHKKDLIMKEITKRWEKNREKNKDVKWEWMKFPKDQ